MVIINIKLTSMAKYKEEREKWLETYQGFLCIVMFYSSVRFGMYRVHSILINNYYLKYHVSIVDTLFRMSMVHFIAKHFLKSDGRVQCSAAGDMRKVFVNRWCGAETWMMWADLSKESLRWAFPKEHGKANVKTLGHVSLMVSGTREKICRTIEGARGTVRVTQKETGATV